MKIAYTFLFGIIFSLSTFAQTYKTVTLIEQRNHSLNGGFRSSIGGQSRVLIKIDLPENTVRWFYSFTTSPGESGSKTLNLALQLAASISTNGLSQLASSQFTVPSGLAAVDVFLIDTKYRSAFENKDDGSWTPYNDVSVEKSKQAVQSVDSTYGDSFYLGIRNPSTLDAVNILIEVVAIVEEVNTEAQKGYYYGSLGLKSYERGEFDKCIEYSTKALLYNSNLTWVKFNIALVHLIQNNNNCIDEYINAVSAVKKDSNPKLTLATALKDLNDLTNKYHYTNLNYLIDAKDLIHNAYRTF